MNSHLKNAFYDEARLEYSLFFQGILDFLEEASPVLISSSQFKQAFLYFDLEHVYTTTEYNYINQKQWNWVNLNKVMSLFDDIQMAFIFEDSCEIFFDLDEIVQELGCLHVSPQIVDELTVLIQRQIQNKKLNNKNS